MLGMSSIWQIFGQNPKILPSVMQHSNWLQRCRSISEIKVLDKHFFGVMFYFKAFRWTSGSCLLLCDTIAISLTYFMAWKAVEKKKKNPLLCTSYTFITFSFTPRIHTATLIDKLPLWYLCHIFNMDMGMIIKSIVAKSVWSALNNEWARMRLNLWGRAERQGKCSHRPLRPPPSLSVSPERHYSGRSFLPSLDIIQCNHPSIKNLPVIKGTTRVNTQNIEKDDPVLGDGV